MNKALGILLSAVSGTLTLCGFLGLFKVGSITIDWFFLGSTFGLNDISLPFFIITNFVWFLAFLYSFFYIQDKKQTSYFFYTGLMYLGNILTVLSQDLGSFYLFFSLMGFSTYGIIIHDKTNFSRLAGKRYIFYTIASEMLLFAGLVGLYLAGNSLNIEVARQAIINTPFFLPISLCIFLGVGIKLGLMPLHGWLPFAHPAAPVPASAVLSGVIIKTGLFGFLRLLPIGSFSSQEFGIALAIIGLFTTITAAILGIIQKQPKAILAYSSISQMGFLGILSGLLVINPKYISTLLPIIMLFVIHHALAKSSLFLSCGIYNKKIFSKKSIFSLLVLIPGLSLAGLPFTSGAITKILIKKASIFPLESLTYLFSIALPITSITTALLIFRFVSQLLTTNHDANDFKELGKKTIWLTSAFSSLLLPIIWVVNHKVSFTLFTKTSLIVQVAPIFLAGSIFLLGKTVLNNLSFDITTDTEASPVTLKKILTHKDEISYGFLILFVVLLSSLIFYSS